MSNMSVGQIIMDAQRIASRVKDLELLGNALLVEAEGNNRLVESLRQFQDDMDALNHVTNNKSNSEMVNRIQQQNATSSEILKENRELKICIEDYERTMEFIMQKYREHTTSKILESKINFKEVYNEELWIIIREQRAKIKEMAVVMQRAASADDDALQRDMETMSRLRKENQILRELLQISKQFGSANQPIKINDHMLQEKGVQTEEGANDDDDSGDDELSLSATSMENINNNSVISVSPNVFAVGAPHSPNNSSTNNTNTADIVNNDVLSNTKAATIATPPIAENNNGPLLVAAAAAADTESPVTISVIPPIKPADILSTSNMLNSNTGGNAHDTVTTQAPATGKQTKAPTATANTTAATTVEPTKTAT